MKILIFSDVHWSTYTSIVRQRGSKFSQRLELLIASMNWVNGLAEKEGCQAMICGGDFMDKSSMTDEEITALKDIFWNDLPCYFVVGNHESSVSNLQFKSVDALDSEHHLILSEPKTIIEDEENKVLIHVLPYVTESDRKELSIKTMEGYKNIIISHNDLKDVQYGGFLSKTGYSIDEIEKVCDLFINGHIHNNGWITKKILNVGSFTAHNFTNDSTTYEYGVWILDTEDLSVKFYENPNSLNFYKFEFSSAKDLKKLENLKPNAVISIKCPDTLKDSVLEAIGALKSVITYKIIYTRDLTLTEGSVSPETITSKDHLEQFKEYIIQTLGSGEVVLQELQEVCK